MSVNEASERQIQAARPDMSTWLAANAGSGKTRVLTDRVARLLLDGTDPQKILCLTYTKAAAGEMQNRLFQRLGQWAMLADAPLSRALAGLGVTNAVSPQQLRRARTLFARAIETPGGLKIQTIHSFCASLLRRFPLEAGVSPAFREMDDRAAALMTDDVLNDIAEGPDRHVLDDLCRFVDDQSLIRLVNDVISRRAAFSPPTSIGQLKTRLNLRPETTRQEIEDRVFLGNEASLFEALVPVLAAHSKTDARAATKLGTVKSFGWIDLPVLEGLFLFGPGAKTPYLAKIDSFPTKACRAALGPELMPLQDLMRRVELARSDRLALLNAEKTACLHRFAQVLLAELSQRKQARGWLDFDDLIQKSRQLLATPEVADWVLYRLDGGIDHILVDEAQDTSPDQWDVIERLAKEFTSGIGARADTQRTLFVVGDKKQSIYSFQGADPGEFDRMQAEFGSRFRNIGSDLQDLSLEFSFRSSDAILRLVDLVFEAKGASGFDRDGRHRAFKADLPGRVDLWPVIAETKAEEDGHWADPVDRPGPRHHSVLLAEQIADQIRDMLESDQTIPVDGASVGSYAKRRIHPGDILILLQRRSDLFSEIIRACKARNLPVAGADRLRVGAELAVKDLASLLRFLATPEDSLSLAEALKSPLFGWDEQALFDLAHRRTEPFLWQALRNRQAEYPETMQMLHDLRTQSDFLRPYDLIERILTRHRGRQNLLARLGAEAEDGINALLSQALAYEQNEVPSLTGFIVWMETDDLEIKRQSDNSGNLIRVITVHGAKGLEAPIVILPDTAVRRPPTGSDIMLADGIPFWKPSKGEMPDALKEAAEEKLRKEMNERDRLLYVALTRAEKWLIIAAGGKTGTPGDSWYADVEDALIRAGAGQMEMPGGNGLRLSHGDWAGCPLIESGVPETEIMELPEVFRTPHTPRARQTPTVSPSDLGGAKALPGEQGLDTEAAKKRGTQIHSLLEHLPAVDPKDRAKTTRNLLPPDATGDIANEALAVLGKAELGFLFEANTLSEVSVTAAFGENRLMGTIDRLIVGPNKVLAVDFKSNAVVPDSPEACPEGVLRQLGAYAVALKQVYPDREIETAIVWTRTAEIMYLPHDIVTAALSRTGWVDAAQDHS